MKHTIRLDTFMCQIACHPLTQGEDAGLLVSLDDCAVGRPVTDEAIAAQWFSQDVFADAPPLAAAAPAPAQKLAGAGRLSLSCS